MAIRITLRGMTEFVQSNSIRREMHTSSLAFQTRNLLNSQINKLLAIVKLQALIVAEYFRRDKELATEVFCSCYDYL